MVKPLFEQTQIILEVLDERSEDFRTSSQTLDILPTGNRNPTGRNSVFHIFQGSVSFQEEVKFVLIDLPFTIQDIDSHLQGEHQFVHFEHT